MEDGPADGVPLVLLHGFPDDPSTWAGVVPLLPPGVRVIRPFLRGYGPSRVLDAALGEAGGAQVAALASDVLDLTTALGLEDFFLVGHDWGARAANGAAVLAPARVRGLITLSTAYGPVSATGPHALDDAAAAWYRYWLCTAAGAEAFAAEPLALTRWAFEHWGPAPLPVGSEEASFANPQFVPAVIHYYRHGAGEAAGFGRYEAAQAQLDRFPPLPGPPTFVIGLADGCEVPAASVSVPGERVELPGVGHFVQRERPEELAALIVRTFGL